jgi:cytochrome c-type biogenesis protein CcmH
VNESILFMICAGLLLLFVVVYFWAALKSAVYKNRSQQNDSKEAMMANVAVYREQLTELAAEFEVGRLTEQEFEVAREELSQRLMEDSKVHTEALIQARNSSSNAPSFELDSPPALASDSLSADDLKSDSSLNLPANDSAALAFRRAPTAWVRWTLPTLCVLIPALSITLYLGVGTPSALDFEQTEGAQQEETFTPEKLAQMADELNKRLSEQPNNADGWVMLGRVERSLAHFDLAEKALSKALTLSANDDVQVERAEVLAQMNHGSFKGEPWAILLKVLKANPDQGNALLLAGSAAFSEERYADALKYWQRVQTFVAPNSPDGMALAQAISKAKERIAVKGGGAPSAGGGVGSATSQTNNATLAASTPPSPASTATQRAGAPVKARIMGRVAISSALATKIHQTDTVFIYAVPVSGSRMPLAMIRTTVGQMPYEFVLDDSNAMNPVANLSSVSEVLVKARISASGNAMPQPGDYGVTLGPIKVGSQNLRLTIEEALK